MIRNRGFLRRKLSFTEQELDELAHEFAEYAAEDIADLLGLERSSPLLSEIATEVAHAINCTIDELPHEGRSPAHSIRLAAEAFGAPLLAQLMRSRS